LQFTSSAQLDIKKLSEYRIASRPDDANCNVHETLAFTINQHMETTRKPFSTFKENTQGSIMQ